MKKILMIAVAAVASSGAFAALAAEPEQEQKKDQALTVGEVLDVTAGLNQLARYETIDKDGKAGTAIYKFSPDLRYLIALNIDMGRRLQTQIESIRNDIVMQSLDPATGKVAESKVNTLAAETGKLLTPTSRVVLYRIKCADLKLEENPIPAPVLSLIIPILDRCVLPPAAGDKK